MDFLIFNKNDEFQFFRSDAIDDAHTEELLTFTAVFPIVQDKMIERGMRIGFTDIEGNFQLFEIRTVTNSVPANEQSIDVAEHVAISELSDDVIESETPTDVSADSAATTALSGTLWSLGAYVSSDNNSTKWDMITAWAGLCDVRNTWGVRIKPRMTVSGTTITGRHIDILSTTPTNRGVILTIDKNIKQAGVTYDDTNLYTALYGLGKEIQDDTGSERLTFSGIEWSVAGGDPYDKPIGQKWVEDATMTALYGRNGRKRVGIVEFSEIEDVYDLIDATWEYLQSLSPDITIDGTIIDLYQLGYNDELILLNDSVTTIIDPIGVQMLLGVSGMERHYTHPENTRPTIGVYKTDIVQEINNNIAETRSNGRVIGQPANGLYTGYIAIYENKTIINNAEVDIQTDDFQVKNLDGNNMLQITAEDEETGEPGARLKLGESGYPPLFEDDFVLPLLNGGFGDTVHNIRWVSSVPSNGLGVDGDVAVRYSGSGSSFSDITPSLGSYETATRFGKSRVWNYERISGYRRVGNTSSELDGCYWSFTCPAGGLNSMSFNFTSTKYISPDWYGWNFDISLTVAVFSSTGSSVALASNTFIPDNNATEYNIPLMFGSSLTGGNTYYVAIYDASATYNKSACIIQASSVVIPGETATESSVSVYIKTGGVYVDSTAAVLAAIAGHLEDAEAHSALFAEKVPTSRTVNGKALSSNVTLDETDVGAAADDHAHGNISNAGKIGANAGYFIVTGTNGLLGTYSTADAKTLLNILISDVATTAGITDIQIGTSTPGSLSTGVIYLKYTP